MIRKITIMAIAGASALALAGCQSSGTDWGKVAAGTALVVSGSGQTAKIDPRVAQVSSELARYCPMLQVAAIVGALALPEKKRAAGLQASAALNEVCAAPPADVAAAIIVAQRAVAAAQAAGIRTSPS